MTLIQIVLALMALGALVYTVLAYPGKYGALSGRSRLFRTIGVSLLDLLLLLVLLATSIDFNAGVSPRIAQIRAFFYLSSCLFLCLSLVCVAALDALESYSQVRRERRNELERVLRADLEKFGNEMKDRTDAETKKRSDGNDNGA